MTPGGTFSARRSRGGDLAAPIAALILFAALAALVLGASREPGVAMVGLCVLAALLAAVGTVLMIWGMSYQRLGYKLTDSALRIEWLGRTVIVPYLAIQGIYTGQRLEGHAMPSAPRWPGINVGTARVRGMGRLRFFATSADQSLLTYITVEHGGVILSANDPNAFRAALIEHVERFGETFAERAEAWHQKEPSDVPWTAFADAWLPACVGLGTLALLLVLGSIALRYDALPDQVPLHFDASGQPSQIAPKSDLLRLPLLGLVCLAVNWAVGVVVHPRDRALGRLVWITGAIVQLVLFVGILDVLRLGG